MCKITNIMVTWFAIIHLAKFDVGIGTEVWLTVSSLAGFDKNTNKQFERQLELNWKRTPNRTDLWIALFDEEPKDEKLSARGKNYSIEWLAIGDQSSGRHRTSFQMPYKKFSKKTLNSNCLKYWIGLIESNRVIAKDCIRVQPFWMEQNLRQIGDKRLDQLMIPGTHNSASYDRYYHKEDNLFTMYSLCQDENIFNQLVFGIRFLDLRVAYDHHEGQNYKMWIVHGPLIMKHTLNSILAQVKRFIDLAPKEVVVLDFHRLEKGFDKDEYSPKLIRRHHRKLWALIGQHLGQHLVFQQTALNFTLNQLIAKNKRVVIGYPSNEFVSNKSYVSPQTKHLWPNTDQIDEMIEFFDETLCEEYSDQLYSAMAQLTASQFGIFLNRYNGLRGMADRVNRIITDRFSDHSSWAECANVVATDYLLGNHIIDISIKENLIRAKKT